MNSGTTPPCVRICHRVSAGILIRDPGLEMAGSGTLPRAIPGRFRDPSGREESDNSRIPGLTPDRFARYMEGAIRTL